MSSKKFSLLDRIKSFGHAINGFRVLFKEEHNARVHLVVTIVVLSLGAFFSISVSEWLIIILTIGFVFVTEILNTAIEDIADFRYFLTAILYSRKSKFFSAHAHLGYLDAKFYDLSTSSFAD